MKLKIQLRRVMRDSIRVYFAPLTGAVKGIRAELHRADREVARHRASDSKDQDSVRHA